SRETTASFSLKPARFFELISEPAGASVELYGERIAGVTPIKLPGIVLGETATVTATLEGYLPGLVKLIAADNTATIAHVKLEPAKIVDVVSEPANAKVSI